MEIKHPWLLFLGLTLGPFMVGIDLLAVAIAIEPMTKALSIDISTLQWFLSAYGIGNACFLIPSGRLSDLFGKKVILMWGLAVFILSSLIISFSNSAFVIILARLLQGASGGVLFVVAIATITAIHYGCHRTKWISRIMGAAGLGMVVGPAVGGWLIHHFSWRMIFLINIPVGLIALLFVLFYMPALKPTSEKGEKVDWLGVVILTAAFFILMIGISQGHYWGWTSLKVWSCFVGAILLFALFVWVEKRVRYPLVIFEMFKVKNFLAASLTGFVLFFSFTSWILIFGIYLERVLGLTPEQAGYIFFPFGIVLLIFSIRMGTLSQMFGPKMLITIGFIASAIAFIGLAALPVVPSYWLLILYFSLFGLCFVMVNSNSVPAALEYMPPEKVGLATGKAQMWRWFGGALGAVITTAIFMHFSSARLNELAKQNPQEAYLHEVLVGSQNYSTLKEKYQGENLRQVQQILDRSYHRGLVASMSTLAALSIAALLLTQVFITDPKKKVD